MNTSPGPLLVYYHPLTAIVTGLVETHFRTARCAPTVKPHVPSTAASGIAQPCRLDGCSHTCRLRAPIQVRCKTRKANEHSRYMRVMRLVNQRRLSRQTDEVDQKSCALRLLAATHRGLTSGEHLLELEPALRPLLTFTCSVLYMCIRFRGAAAPGSYPNMVGDEPQTLVCGCGGGLC